MPNQHGAWAMLAVPFLTGVVRGGPIWAHLLLLVCWLVGYFAFFAAGQWLRSRRSTRLRTPVLVYGLATLAFGAPLVAMRPDLLVWGAVYLPLAAISLGFSARRDDRALLNDAATIIAACLMTPVAYQLGQGSVPWSDSLDWHRVWWATVALLCYFFGTSLYVKTVIRERTNAAYHRASVGYHAAVVLFWAIAGWWGAPIRAPVWCTLLGFFAVMTIRAAVMAGRRVKPMSVGLGELAASTVLLAVVLAV
ncbi:MAG TPA: YwiC-like family protein [Dermatophilaceae bacterium]|nr:YwiC-like family protein [Dermatophilaceae bacterium]